MKIAYTQEAIDDLRLLRDFIGRYNKEVAARVSLNLRQNIKKLKNFPYLGRKVDGEEGVRDLVAGRYIARYMVRLDTIYILRVWHQREDLIGE
jgi:plasmid stabilization system protein ParE